MNSRVYTIVSYQHSGSNAFVAFTSGSFRGLSTLTLEQVVTIRIGVTVKVGVWFKGLRPNHSTISPFTVTLTVDNIQVATWNPNSNAYTEIVSTSNTLLGSATQSSHTISLTVQSVAVLNQVIFATDDFYVTPISGPNGETICDAP